MAREDACRYLAACYYQPETAFAEEKVFPSLLDAVARFDADLVPYARQLGAEFARARTEDLLLDYTRLFLGPMQILAKPYGSVWLEENKTLMGDTTMAVIALYQEGGFEIDEEFREVPDHIAVELEFLYLLIFQENEARSSGDAARLKAVADLKARFLDQHLGRWIGPFTEAVKGSAESVFYRQLAELTALFVGREARQAAG
ncbi:MAG: molecular chaperone TorD family protein [Rhodocyclaceae bacterium]|nr:molecular chaperone TorD family protein [Rhodocyclaceae bacterium]